MSALYFAYGSNMPTTRLRARVASARPRGAARLDGWRLRLDKHGRDGSAKANLAQQASGVVWGVVFQLDAAELGTLDRFEGGYRRVQLQVELVAGPRLEVLGYVSDPRTPLPVAFDWYRDLLVAGAREHRLPPTWVAGLAGLPARPDPRPEPRPDPRPGRRQLATVAASSSWPP